MRTLERRFRQTGAVEDEAAWLRERLRAAEIDRERVALAEFCGHVAAARALDSGCDEHELCLRCYPAVEALRGLERRGGAPARLRALIAATRVCASAVVGPAKRTLLDVVAALERRAVGQSTPTDEELRRLQLLVSGRWAAPRLAISAVVVPARPTPWADLGPLPREPLLEAIRDEVVAWALAPRS